MAERGVIFKDDFVSTPGKSWFDMSYDFLFSMNFGELVPATCMECMPADVIHAKSDSFVRLAPLVSPVFGKLNMFSYHFYVRNKDIWTQWKSFFENADSRLSWQQAMSSGFTPPEMPYINIFQAVSAITSAAQVLSPSDSNYKEPFVNGIGFDYTSVSSDVVNLADASWVGVSWLYLYENDGEFKSAIILDGNVGADLYKDNEAILIPFLRNKYETQLENVLDPDSFLNGYCPYNPFSAGSLFDYLGVDLCGHYAKQLDWVKSAISKSKTALNSSADIVIDSHFVPAVPDYVNDFEKNFIPYSFDADTFFKNHLIFGCVFNHNNQFVAIASTAVKTLIGSQTHASDVSAISIDPLFTLDNENANISSLCIRAYHFIYNEYFRDENYISINENVDFSRDGNDLNFNKSCQVLFDYLTLDIKAYEHDCYTSALPQAQRGNSVHFLPQSSMSGKAPVYFDQTSDNISAGSQSGWQNFHIKGTGTNKNPLVARLNGNNGESGNTYSDFKMAYADLSGATFDLSAATIENFRFANATQRYLEKVARSGSRYYEYLKAIFGSDVPSEKLDKPIFLGGDKTPVQVSEVLQTSASQVTDDQPLGQMAGRAIAIGNDDRLEYICPDSGFFIELCAVLPRTNYQQGLSDMFTRKTYLDYPIPDYAQLGEEPVYQRSLWFSADDSDMDTFGFQSRYWSWKYNRDKTAGQFKDSLSHWTWSRIFDEAPVQGRKFIEVNPDYRQFAVTDKNVEHVYVHMFHDLQVNRSLPVFGMPSI